MSTKSADMKRILIRSDASLLMGSGHVMRCRTLARELQRHGAEVSFLCHRQPGDLINLLESEFAVLALPNRRWLPVMEKVMISIALGLVPVSRRMPLSAYRFWPSLE